MSDLYTPNIDREYRLIFKEWVPLKKGSLFQHTTSATDMAMFVITTVEREGFVFIAKLVEVPHGPIPWLM